MNEYLEMLASALASMSDIWEKLIILLVGWLMGLLAPAIVDRIKRKRENKLGREAILSELHDLGGVLAVVVYMTKLGDGTLDREAIKWLKDCMDSGKRNEELMRWITRLADQLTWTDEQIAEYAAMDVRKDGKTSVILKYPVPLLDSRVSALWSFENDFQRRLLDVRQHMHRLDDLVDRSRKLQDMTFTNLSDFNRKMVEGNINETMSLYGRTAKRVVDKIAALQG